MHSRFWLRALTPLLLVPLFACGGAAKYDYAPSAPAGAMPQMETASTSDSDSYVAETSVSGSTGGGAYAPKAAAPSPPTTTPTPTTPNAPPSAPADPRTPEERRLLVYRAEISLAVYQVEPNLAAIEKIAKDSGGYLALREDRRIIIRVPKARFEEALGKVEAVGDVLHRNVVAEDVSDRFQDLAARLRNLKSVRDKLESFLQKANVKESIEIQSELTKITEQIELIEGKLKLLSDQIAYSTITVNFAPKTDGIKRSDFRLPFPVLGELGLQTLLRLNEPSSSVR